jgi:hypothetical protein
MTYSLYSVLPTEIVWKIYDDLHKSYTKDLNKELKELKQLTNHFAGSTCVSNLEFLHQVNLDFLRKERMLEQLKFYHTL